MTITEFRTMLRAEPFREFAINLAAKRERP